MRRTALLLLLALLAGPGQGQSTTRPQAAQPHADIRFGYSAPDPHIAPLTVRFSSTPPAGARVSWDFGDGAGAEGSAPEHTYYRPGSYTAAVTVRTAQGEARGQLPLTVLAGGPEQARVVLLMGDTGRFSFDAGGSTVYAPLRPSWWLDGVRLPARPDSADTGPLNVAPGRHSLRLDLPGQSGTLSRTLTFVSGPLGGSTPFELEVLRLTNAARAGGWDCTLKVSGGRALPPLIRNPQLDLAARAQAAGMALNGYADHQSPIDGSHPQDRVRAAGYPYAMTGENIAGGQRSPQEVVDAWLRSPGHCHNIMGAFHDIGLAYATRPGSPLTTYWAQAFGTPR